MGPLQEFFRKTLLKSGKVLIRPPKNAELSKYWSGIAWDIVDPVLIVESSDHRFLFEIPEEGVRKVIDLSAD